MEMKNILMVLLNTLIVISVMYTVIKLIKAIKILNIKNLKSLNPFVKKKLVVYNTGGLSDVQDAFPDTLSQCLNEGYSALISLENDSHVDFRYDSSVLLSQSKKGKWTGNIAGALLYHHYIQKNTFDNRKRFENISYLGHDVFNDPLRKKLKAMSMVSTGILNKMLSTFHGKRIYKGNTPERVKIVNTNENSHRTSIQQVINLVEQLEPQALNQKGKDYFFDTEFLDLKDSFQVISIGFYCEDGRSFYAENSSFDYIDDEHDNFVLTNVLPHLKYWGNENSILDVNETKYSNDGTKNTYVYGDLEYIGKELIKWFGKDHDPIFYAYVSSYDYFALSKIYGGMMHNPRWFPWYARDLAAIADMNGFDHHWRKKNVPRKGTHHNAIDDAIWNYHLKQKLEQHFVDF